MAANASVVALSAKRGARRVPLDQKFFVAYRKTVIEDDEILTGIWIPYSNEVRNILHCPPSWSRCLLFSKKKQAVSMLTALTDTFRWWRFHDLVKQCQFKNWIQKRCCAAGKNNDFFFCFVICAYSSVVFLFLSANSGCSLAHAQTGLNSQKADP